MDPFETLLAGFLEGDLSPAETIDLVRLLEADASRRSRFRDLAGIEGLIRAQLATATVQEDLVRRISMVLVDANQEEKTAAGIMERIQDRNTRRPTPRRLRAIRPRPSGPDPALIWGLAAAAALIILGFLAFPSRPAPVPKAAPVVRSPELHAPPAPLPAPPLPPPPPTPKQDPIESLPKPKPLPPPPPPPVELPPPAEPPKPRPTVTSIARLEQVQGKIEILTEGRKQEGRAGLDLLSAQGLETGSESRAVIAYPDGTRLEVHGGTVIREFGDANHVTLSRGTVAADVKPQPAGRPFILRSDQADATVLGTRLLFTVGSAATRLEVSSGLVRLVRREDQASVEVSAGHEATAGRGLPLAAVPTMAIVGFTLINADTDRPIAGYDPIPEGATINLAKLPTRRLNMRANATAAPLGCVQFGLDDNPEFNTERGAPFALVTSAAPGDFSPWTPAPGPHAVTATPFSGPPGPGKRTGTGTRGRSLTLRFTVVDRK